MDKNRCIDAKMDRCKNGYLATIETDRGGYCVLFRTRLNTVFVSGFDSSTGKGLVQHSKMKLRTHRGELGLEGNEFVDV